ncbi:MAG: 50S ribosomal protein L25 [Lentisphaeria bacterium]|nr:50S ribosomal protein L25 [Lentisphaeria bacterium]
MSKTKHEIAVTLRTESGSGPVTRARKKGLVPGIVYSKNTEPKQIYLNAGEWTSLYRQNPHLVYLNEDGKTQPALVKEVQINHLKGYFYHIDFQTVSADEALHSTLSLIAFGECAGGVLEQNIHELEIVGKADALVDTLRVDVSALNAGQHLTVADLQLPEGLTCALAPETVLFTVVAPTDDTAVADSEMTEPEAIKQKKSDDSE